MKEKLLKKEDFLSFELKFLATLSLVAIAACLLTVITNIFVGLPYIMYILPALMTFFFTWFYYWAKSGKRVLALKIACTIVTLIIINLFWRYNNGSHGPSPYTFIIMFGVLVFIWSGWQLMIVTITFLLNILVVYYFDRTNPHFIPDYPNDIMRIDDVYGGVLIFGVIIFALMTNAKNSLITQFLKAKQADKLKSAFLANMSHEIRTPMNAIVGFSQVLNEPDISDAEKKKFADLICTQSQYLLSFINELVDISRIESGSMILKDDTITVDKIITEITDSIKYLNKDSIEIKIVHTDELAGREIIIDANRLRQVLINLMTNALKYTNAGYIELGYSLTSQKFIKFYVKDTGIGIPSHEINKIFERFYQVETKSKSMMNKGTGLGLAIVKALVKLMGGAIWVESIENKGSAFYFTIPYKPSISGKSSH